MVNTFDDKPIDLTDEERQYVATTEFDEWLYSEGLSDLMEEHRDVYWVQEHETTSEKIVRAQCESILRSYKKELEAQLFLSDMLNSADPLK